MTKETRPRQGMIQALALLIGLLVASTPLRVSAEAPQPVAGGLPQPVAEAPQPVAGGLHQSVALGLHLNYLGLGLFSDTAWRTALSDSTHVLLANTYVDVGATAQLSPAFFHPGVYVEVVPLQLLKLRAAAYRLHYFGTFGALQEHADLDFHPDTLERAEEEGENSRATGKMFMVDAQLRLKVGGVVALLSGRRTWYRFDDTFVPVYDPSLELLLASEDRLDTLDALLGYVVSGTANQAGSVMPVLRYEHQREDRLELRRHALAVGTVYKPETAVWSTGDPTIVGLAGLYLSDRYRTNAPYGALLLRLQFAEGR